MGVRLCTKPKGVYHRECALAHTSSFPSLPLTSSVVLKSEDAIHESRQISIHQDDTRRYSGSHLLPNPS